MSRVLINGQDVNMTDGFPQMNYDEWKALPRDLRPDFTVITDRDYTSEPLDNSVSVTADGVKTYSQLLNELYTLIDGNKVSRNSVFKTEYNGYVSLYSFKYTESNRYLFTYADVASNQTVVRSVDIMSSGSKYCTCTLTSSISNQDKSSNVVNAGFIFTLYYNIVSSGGVEPDIFYKDIPIAGVQVSDYYATVNTGVDSSEYTCIGMNDVAGAGWDQNTIFRVSTGNVLKILSMRTASYTIANNAPPIRMYFVKKGRVNATPLT